jgi:hypothetical protein
VTKAERMTSLAAAIRAERDEETKCEAERDRLRNVAFKAWQRRRDLEAELLKLAGEP